MTIAPWSNVTERPHPFGTEGVNQSLDEVAKRVAKGALDPAVRTWSIEILDEARKSGVSSVNNNEERARVLLKAVQQKLWVPDPVGAEYMPAAKLLACDPNKNTGSVCIRGDDCDGLATLLGAAWSSVGIFTLVVGHGYDEEGNIEHVLDAAWINGAWRYGDPSTDLPLGQCVPFKHERVISIPNLKVVCDDDVCIGASGARHLNPDRVEFVEKGVFIGVDGIRMIGLRTKIIWKPAGEKLQKALGLARRRV